MRSTLFSYLFERGHPISKMKDAIQTNKGGV